MEEMIHGYEFSVFSGFEPGEDFVTIWRCIRLRTGSESVEETIRGFMG